MKTKSTSSWAALLALALGLSACSGDPDATDSIVAQNDSYAVPWNRATPLDVLVNDQHAAAPTLTVLQAPAHGQVAVSGNGIVYTPTDRYVGPDQFSYTLGEAGQTAASTATVNLQVTGKITLSGMVSVAPQEGTTVDVLAGTTKLASAATNAQGAYQATVEFNDLSAFLHLKSTGAGSQRTTVLASLLGDLQSLVDGLPAEVVAASAATGVATVTAKELPAVQLSAASTAHAVLVQQALGGLPSTSQAMEQASGFRPSPCSTWPRPSCWWPNRAWPCPPAPPTRWAW